MKKKILLVAALGLIVSGLASCDKLDIVGDKSVTSFEAVLQAEGNSVTEDTTFGGWSLVAPDNTTRLLWSKDYSKTKNDVQIETDAKPFLDAGLDTSKLPEGMYSGDKLIFGVDLGDKAFADNGEDTPASSYQQFVKQYRDNLKYHAALDHFGIDISGGNVFEWAKDMKKNDKDIVFALNPQIFIDAGVDTGKIDGWIFAKVTTMDSRGKKIQVDKLLKPFNLE